MNVLGTGIYPLQQAARLVGVETRSIRRWVRGYGRLYKGERVRSEPLWRTQLEDAELPGEVIGFRDLLELRMVAQFVKHGVSLQVIRATLDAAASYLGRYPLTNQQFLTDGKRIFMQAVQEASGEPPMIDVIKRQLVFSDIIKPSLYAGIEYDGKGARRWYPVARRRSVVLDPGLQFGTPVLAEVGIATDTIYASFLAEGKDRAAVARIFDITPKMVADAVDFEGKLAA